MMGFCYAVVAGIALLLLIPLLMVESLVGNRPSLPKWWRIPADIAGWRQLPARICPSLCGTCERNAAYRQEGDDEYHAETRLEASYFVILPSRLSLTPH